MLEIAIRDRKVGSAYPVLIVAEACDNHLGCMDKAREMIRRAKSAKADVIKFQHHLPDEEMLPDVPMTSNFHMPLYEFLKKYALTLRQHVELKALCDEEGIQYMCTPFSLRAAGELHKAGILDVIKIGSGEMTDIPSLLKMASFGLPMIVSTGMSTWDEVQQTYDALVAEGVALGLMHCLSEYPPCYEDVNLRVIPMMRQRFPKAIIGHSDHTPTLYTSYAACALGACIIEKHVILDKRQPGPDQAVSIDFEELADLVAGIRAVEAALGADKKVHEREQGIRAWAFRSVVAVRPIRAGTVIRPDDVWSKRPGTGIPAKKMDRVIGRTAKHDIPANSLIQWDDLE